MREAAADDRCPPGEDLTAYAHGEGDASARARVARHLLACAECRRAHAQDAELLRALAGLGAARASRADARPTADARRWPRWLAWAPPLAASLLIGLALALPRSEPRRATAVVATLGARAAHLLGTQAPDGHWEAESGPVGTVPEAATGLVLLALERDRDPAASAPPALREALARGGRWLAGRVLDPEASPPLREAGAGAQAVALAALVGVPDLAAEPGVDPAREVLLDRLNRAIGDGPLDATARAWVDYALLLSESAGLRGARGARRELAEVAGAGGGAPRPTSPAPRPASGAAEAVACTPVRIALETLRDEAPMRALALGPACFLPDLAPPR